MKIGRWAMIDCRLPRILSNKTFLFFASGFKGIIGLGFLYIFLNGFTGFWGFYGLFLLGDLDV